MDVLTVSSVGPLLYGHSLKNEKSGLIRGVA